MSLEQTVSAVCLSSSKRESPKQEDMPVPPALGSLRVSGALAVDMASLHPKVGHF